MMYAAVSCLHCTAKTVNIVTPEHLDIPFHNDAAIRYVPTTIEDTLLHDVDGLFTLSDAIQIELR